MEHSELSAATRAIQKGRVSATVERIMGRPPEKVVAIRPANGLMARLSGRMDTFDEHTSRVGDDRLDAVVRWCENVYLHLWVFAGEPHKAWLDVDHHLELVVAQSVDGLPAWVTWQLLKPPDDVFRTHPYIRSEEELGRVLLALQTGELVPYESEWNAFSTRREDL